ncbi:MAG: hypothetical protein GY903_30660 [Fuerstiella sp.]|nr:hypothetical protein [Fuerstiella sp.]MCP4858854.1 hypothetical protein [Fuerstiella sp.]
MQGQRVGCGWHILPQQPFRPPAPAKRRRPETRSDLVVLRQFRVPSETSSPRIRNQYSHLRMATSLHQQLKLHYVADECRHEVEVDGFRIDAVDDQERLIEVQCASLMAIRDKIRKLTVNHHVVVVKPLCAKKKLLKKARRNGRVQSRRYSPAHQTLADVFLELVHFTQAFPHPNLQLDVLLTEQEEIRVPPKRRTWRRKFSVQDRTLVSVDETYSFKTPQELWSTLHIAVPDTFTTAELAEGGKMPRWLAQKAAYCFRKMKFIEPCGKLGNAIEYRLADSASEGARKAA